MAGVAFVVTATLSTMAETADEPCLMALGKAPATAPKFGDFPAAVVSIAKPAAVDLRSAQGARQFRTVLREGAADGPNFAGHYTIVGWGCGSSCLDWAIVDALNGQVFFSPDSRIVSAVHVDVESGMPGTDTEYTALRFRRDSKVIAVLGAPNEDAAREGITWYRWTGHSLQKLAFVALAKICGARP